MTVDAGPAYELILRGGRVVDPSQDLDALLDLAISGGHIARLAKDIEPGPGTRLIDVDGLMVVPGLIDLHTHVAGGLRKIVGEETVLPVDLAGVYSGVTTLVDAGSTGAYNVGGLVNFAIPSALTRAYVYLNVGVMGASGSLGGGQSPEIRDLSDIDADASVRAIRSSELIRGVKVRMVSPAVRDMGIDLARQAKEIASRAGVPLMVHVGDIHADDPTAVRATRLLLSEVLEKSDIVTHTASHRVGALLVDGALMEEAREARSRGVWFDGGVGRSNFSFDSARAVLEQEFVPDSISSDATVSGRVSLVHSLTECMGKYMAVGLSLEDVIRMTTAGPARILGMEGKIGTLRVGAEADVTVLELLAGDWLFRDITGATATSSLALTPRLTVRAGEIIPLDYGPRPWGWEPERR